MLRGVYSIEHLLNSVLLYIEVSIKRGYLQFDLSGHPRGRGYMP